MEFTLTGLDGQKLSMAGLKGKVVVFDFWATWCEPCRGQHPLYEQVKQRFQDNSDVVFLSIDTDEDREPVRRFLAEEKWPETVYFETGFRGRCGSLRFRPPSSSKSAARFSAAMNGYVPERFVDLLTGRIATRCATNRDRVKKRLRGVNPITGYNLLLHVTRGSGSVAYDGVETPHGKVDRMLGRRGHLYFAGRRLFYFGRNCGRGGGRFRAGRRGPAGLAQHRPLGPGARRGRAGRSFWAGVYSADMNDRTTLRTDLNVFAGFDPKLPPSYRSQPYLFLGNIQPALQRNVRAQMNRLKLTGGDTMNYWINDFRGELLETLGQWDFLLINDSEARLLSGEHNLRRAAAKILEMGRQTL